MNVLFGIICIIIGIVNTASPRTAWNMEFGWKIQDAEPTEWALISIRIGGIVAIIIGIILMFLR